MAPKKISQPKFGLRAKQRARQHGSRLSINLNKNRLMRSVWPCLQNTLPYPMAVWHHKKTTAMAHALTPGKWSYLNRYTCLWWRLVILKYTTTTGATSRLIIIWSQNMLPTRKTFSVWLPKWSNSIHISPELITHGINMRRSWFATMWAGPWKILRQHCTANLKISPNVSWSITIMTSRQAPLRTSCFTNGLAIMWLAKAGAI